LQYAFTIVLYNYITMFILQYAFTIVLYNI
jgi:hypothetical protein